MKTYFFDCQCGRQIRVDAAQVGTQMTCLCGRTNHVPPLRQLARKDHASWDSETGAIEGKTGIEVATRYNPLAYLTFILTPRVVLNGVVHRHGWGTHFYPLEPGPCDVQIYYRWLFFKCGTVQLKFLLKAGHIPRVDYCMPLLPFAEGEINLIK